MKKLTALLCCGMLAMGTLAGCARSDVYETANFRFTAPSVWELKDAEYDKESKTNEMLKFAAYGGSYSVYESLDAAPLYEYTADTDGEEFKELTGYKYPAWESVWSYEDLHGKSSRRICIYIYADGHMLCIEGTDPNNEIKNFETSLTTVLETIEMTGEPIEPPSAEPGEADTAALHVAWSADWESSSVLMNSGNRELALVLAGTQDRIDGQTALIISDEGDAASEQEGIENRLASDGRDTEFATISVARMEDKTLCGVTFDDAVRQVHTFKSDGNETVYRIYYLNSDDRVYSVMLMCDGRGEAHMNDMLSGITMTAK